MSTSAMRRLITSQSNKKRSALGKCLMLLASWTPGESLATKSRPLPSRPPPPLACSVRTEGPARVPLILARCCSRESVLYCTVYGWYMARKQSGLAPVHLVVPCSWDGGLLFSNRAIAPAPSFLSRPDASPIHGAVHKLWVIVLSSLGAKANAHTCSFHRNQKGILSSTLRYAFFSHIRSISGLLCLSLAVKVAPQHQLQPLPGSRGSITSQTCPVLLLPFGTSPILGIIMRHSEFSAD